MRTCAVVVRCKLASEAMSDDGVAEEVVRDALQQTEAPRRVNRGGIGHRDTVDG